MGAYIFTNKNLKSIFIRIVIFSFIILFTSLSCNSSEPENRLQINLEDISCNEVWIKISGISGSEMILNRDNKEVKQFNPTSVDLVIKDDSLIPNKTYIYKAFDVQNQEYSNEITVTTLDTTSHNFLIQNWTFGEDGNTSGLYDVAIINDTSVWGVGEIYLSNLDPNPYSLIKWNGEYWSFKKLYYINKDYQGNDITMLLSNIKSIFAFNNNDIWFVAGSVFHWDGKDSIVEFSYKRLTTTGLLPGINRLWGNSSNNLYGVGDSGTIIYYSNGTWQNIQSGTNLNIVDIWGVPNLNGEYTKYCAAIDRIFKIDEENNLHTLSLEQGFSVGSIWGMTNYLIYTAGTSGLGIYENNRWEIIDKDNLNTIYVIKGETYNNIVGLSSTRSIMHFNGSSWGNLNISESFTFLREDIKNGLMVAVGWTNNKALITIGKQN